MHVSVFAPVCVLFEQARSPQAPGTCASVIPAAAPRISLPVMSAARPNNSLGALVADGSSPQSSQSCMQERITEKATSCNCHSKLSVKHMQGSKGWGHDK